MRAWNVLLSTPLGKILYNHLRCADEGVREILCRLHDSGHKIVIATYVFENHSRLVEKWLKKKGIPLDELILAKKEESASQFKVRAVLQGKCDYFIEDHGILVKAILQKASGVKVIHYIKKEDLEVLLLLRGHSDKQEAPLYFLSRS